MKLKVTRILLTVLLAMTFSASAMAGTNGTVTTTIVDAQGAADVGAVYTAVNIGVGQNDGNIDTSLVAGGALANMTVDVPDAVEFSAGVGSNGAAGTQSAILPVDGSNALTHTPGTGLSDQAGQNNGAVSSELFLQNITVNGPQKVGFGANASGTNYSQLLTAMITPPQPTP